MFRSVFRPVSRVGVSPLSADVADDELVFEEDLDWRPDADTRPEADEAPFVAVSGGSWDRRLTRREKSLRAGLSAGMALVLLLALIGGPGPILAFVARLASSLDATPVAHAERRPPNYLQAHVPAETMQNPEVRLAAANGPDALAYACWVNEDPKYLGEQAAPLYLTRFAVESHNWTTLTPPAAQAAGCSLVTDTSAPASVVLALTQATNASGPCPLPDLYRSDDRGATWRAVLWPANALAPCNVRLQFEGSRLYVETDTPLLPPSALSSGAAGLLTMTPDGGRTWRAADVGMADVANMALVALRPGGRLLAQGDDPQADGATALWQSDDAGLHWRLLTTVPGAQAQLFASSDPADTADGGWGRLYVSAQSMGTPLGTASSAGGVDAAPAGDDFLATGFVGQRWAISPFQLDGSLVPAWSSVPMAPDGGTANARPAGGWLPEASEGPAGSLLFTRPQLLANSNSITPPFDILVWDGHQWRQSVHTIPANAFLQSVSWNDGVMRIWITSKAGITRPIVLQTFTLSPADVS
jgi:hypothetical protein